MKDLYQAAIHITFIGITFRRMISNGFVENMRSRTTITSTYLGFCEPKDLFFTPGQHVFSTRRVVENNMSNRQILKMKPQEGWLEPSKFGRHRNSHFRQLLYPFMPAFFCPFANLCKTAVKTQN